MVMYISKSGHLTYALQNNCLKNYHPLHVPMAIPDYVEILRKNPNIPISDPDRWYVSISQIGQTANVQSVIIVK